jgi:CubicO group peptidase (beta-lactamase class C family)
MCHGRREFLLRSSGAASLFTRSAHAQSGWQSLVSRLEEQVPKLMKQHHVPGVALVLIRDGEISSQRAYGVRDAVSRKTVEKQTVFEAASMSKPVFAYAVMKLCERGVLDLDTPLTKYTPARFLEGDPRLNLITARHVLSHMTGFQNWRTDEEPLKIHFAPGSGFTYSGEGYNYLQTVMARVTKQPFEAYMRTNVFQPFGMASSGYVWNDMFERQAARPHDVKGGALDNRKRTESDIARFGAAGDLHTTAGDYAKFLIEVVKPKPADHCRLTNKSLTEMVRPHVKLAEEYSMSWALGWKTLRFRGRTVISHGGDNTGFHCTSAAALESKSGFVMMTNGESGVALLKDVGPILDEFLAV